MKKCFASVLLAVFWAGCATQNVSQPTTAVKRHGGATPLEWSQRLADSEMGRLGHSLEQRAGGQTRWDSTAGLFTLSLLKLNDALGQGTNSGISVQPQPLMEFSKAAIGSFINNGGGIATYNRDEFKLDSLNSGKTALALWKVTGDARFRGAAYVLHFQLASQPRTPEGGFWHQERYPNQMWLDDIYMGVPFYAECGKVFEEAGDYHDAETQIRLIDLHTYDSTAGLNHPGWDAAMAQSWANPATGCSSNFWGRAEGWYAMALVDVLDYLPAKHPARAEIIAILQKTARGIVRWQDPKTGLWWQVLDQGDRQGNYLEATASSMFVYALAKGINHGYLSREYIPAAENGYGGIIDNLIKADGDNEWSLAQCCGAAGLGGGAEGGRRRDGSFDYYASERAVKNELAGVGPFILAGIEMQELEQGKEPTPGK